jgi:DNA topoisomerase-1
MPLGTLIELGPKAVVELTGLRTPCVLTLALAEFKKYDSQAEAKRNVVAAIERVSKQLGNTPAICRKCYVHPEVLNAYMSGDLVKMIEAKIAQKFKRQYTKLTSDEIIVLAFLHKRLNTLKARS